MLAAGLNATQRLSAAVIRGDARRREPQLLAPAELVVLNGGGQSEGARVANVRVAELQHARVDRIAVAVADFSFCIPIVIAT